MIAKKLENNKSTKSSFYNVLFKLAIPIVIQNLITSSINMIDTVMIGKLGEVQIAAVGIANQYFFLFNLLIVGIASGAGIFISQYWGKKDTQNIHRILGIGLISSIIFSIIFTVIALIIPESIIRLFNNDPYVIELGVSYLRIVSISYIFTAISLMFGIAARCVEDTTTPMLVSILALLVNATFNYIFIFGHFGSPAMGVKGSAISTLIARLVEAFALVLYIYIRKGPLAAKLKHMIDINKSFLKRAITTITPVVVNEMCWAFAMIIYNIAYGNLGTQAMAAMQITTTVQNVFTVFAFGLANASAVMIGHQIGAGNKNQVHEYAKRFLKLSVAVGLFIGVILSLSATTVLSFFNISADVYSSALRILYITSFIMAIRVVGAVNIIGILRGGGDASHALKVEAFTMWGVGVPLAFLGSFVFEFPIEIVVMLVGLEEVAKVIFSLKRLKGNDWVHEVTMD